MIFFKMLDSLLMLPQVVHGLRLGRLDGCRTEVLLVSGLNEGEFISRMQF